MQPVVQKVDAAIPPERIWLWNKKLSGVECETVTEFGACLEPIVDKMYATMQAHNGVGLSAPQIGIFKRISVVHMLDEPDHPRLVMVNPVILDSNGEFKMMEGCLSVPGITRVGTRARTVRASSVYFCFQDINGSTRHLQVDGVMAVAVQHEIDHLSGKFFFETLKPLQKKIILGHLGQTIRKADLSRLAERFIIDAGPECCDRLVAL